MSKQVQSIQNGNVKITQMLNASLADGIDLYSQIKIAHWNVKGQHFVPLHALFDQFASSLAVHNDAIAERVVIIGGEAHGTVRQVATTSRLPDYPTQTRRGLHHVELLLERINIYLAGLREARSSAESAGDATTADLLTGVIADFEKHAWFLSASLEHYTA